MMFSYKKKAQRGQEKYTPLPVVLRDRKKLYRIVKIRSRAGLTYSKAWVEQIFLASASHQQQDA
jgi:hypothetical protein